MLCSLRLILVVDMGKGRGKVRKWELWSIGRIRHQEDGEVGALLGRGVRRRKVQEKGLDWWERDCCYLAALGGVSLEVGLKFI